MSRPANIIRGCPHGALRYPECKNANVCRSLHPTQGPMKQYTPASCFVTYLLPHVLFVPDFGERKRIVQACCLALEHKPVRRRRSAGAAPRHGVEDGRGLDNRKAPPPGLKEGFRQDLRNLIDQKRDLFPWLMTTIPRAGPRSEERT